MLVCVIFTTHNLAPKDITEKIGLLKFTKKLVKITKKCNSQTWLVNANEFAGERYRYTVRFTGKSGNVY